MGLNDAAEMLEAAQAENVKLERALLRVKDISRGDRNGLLSKGEVWDIIAECGL